MDGLEHFYTRDSDFVGMKFIDELHARLLLIETPDKQIMNILNLVSHKVKKFDTLYDIPSVTKYYNELIEKATYEPEYWEIAQRQKLICHFYESHYKSRVLKLSDGLFKTDLTTRMSYDDYIIVIEHTIRNCDSEYIDTLVNIFNIGELNMHKIVDVRKKSHYFLQALDGDHMQCDIEFKVPSEMHDEFWINCDHDNQARFLQIIQKAYPNIEKQNAMLALYKDSERRMKMCTTQEELRKKFETESKFLDYYTKDGHFTYLYELYRKQSFKLSGLQVNLNFDRLILRSDYEAELIRLATNTTKLRDFNSIVRLFVMRFNKEMEEIEYKTCTYTWSDFFDDIGSDEDHVMPTNFTYNTIRILLEHENFLLEEREKRRAVKRQNPEYYVKKIYNLLRERPGNYEDLQPHYINIGV